MAYTPPSVDALAPVPRIRVGLSTSARVVRLTSSSPFRVGSPDHFVDTQDVLIEPMASTVLEGVVYRVQLGSFPDRERALAARSAMSEELPEGGDELGIWRETDTGRFALRLGAYPSESGARARLNELRELGLDRAAVVSEPTRAPRPSALVLRPVGQLAFQTSSLSLVAVPGRVGAFIEVDGNPYRGYVELFVNPASTFTVVNVLNIEDYLLGVVPGELSPKAFPELEAIKAQAIAARTYAVKRLGQFATDGYDICATPACQVYRGVSIEQPMASEAVRDTAGEVLTYEGELVDALYTSTCGGRTENAENVFSSPKPYLVSRACFLEPRGEVIHAANPGPRSLESASLSLLGIASSVDAASVSREQARAWIERVLSYLGQTPCWSSDPSTFASPVDIVSWGRLVGEGLCWERRLPFLISDADAQRIVPDAGMSADARRYLAFAIQEDLVRPSPAGISAGRPMSADDVLASLYRIVVERGDAPLKEGTIRRIESGRLYMTDETLNDDENEISTVFAPEHYLYRAAGASTYYAGELSLLAGDTVRYRMGNGGVDLLVLVSEGATFDRSSRVSHWVVRKSNEDLSREVSSRRDVGTIVDLRPKRYGRSGRIVELEVVGTRGSLELNGLEVRRALGIRENLFFIDAQRRADGSAEGWVFTGRGWGHGVGMCQVGAFGMAAAGYGYRDILRHYYTGTRIERRDLAATALDVDKGARAP